MLLLPLNCARKCALLHPVPPLQVCDSLSDILRPAAYQAVPLLVSILAHSGSEGAKQASASAACRMVAGARTMWAGNLRSAWLGVLLPNAGLPTGAACLPNIAH